MAEAPRPPLRICQWLKSLCNLESCGRASEACHYIAGQTMSIKQQLLPGLSSQLIWILSGWRKRRVPR